MHKMKRQSLLHLRFSVGGRHTSMDQKKSQNATKANMGSKQSSVSTTEEVVNPSWGKQGRPLKSYRKQHYKNIMLPNLLRNSVSGELCWIPFTRLHH